MLTLLSLLISAAPAAPSFPITLVGGECWHDIPSQTPCIVGAALSWTLAADGSFIDSFGGTGTWSPTGPDELSLAYMIDYNGDGINDHDYTYVGTRTDLCLQGSIISPLIAPDVGAWQGCLEPSVRRVHSASPYEPQVGYCRAIRAGDRVVVGGTAPIGAPEGADAYAQARRCIDIITAALAEVGASPEHVVRTRVFLVDAADWPDIGRAHREAFGAHPPVTSFVVAAGLLDPTWRVEIEAEAIVESESPRSP